MADDWSHEEVAATVADYFEMLGCELRGEPYNKRDYNRRLQQMLRSRSAGAVEFKHASICAVRIELGFPHVDGYKPRANYQALPRDEVAARLARNLQLFRAAEVVVDAPAQSRPPVGARADIFVPAPVRDKQLFYERRVMAPPPRTGVDYLKREARNASLGSAGELFALNVEHRRLWESGRSDLAERIEHVSRSQGDGLGYDILSYETDGRERLIEVKTTAFGAMTPFLTTRREVAVSEERRLHFRLYRVFKFRESPRLFS